MMKMRRELIGSYVCNSIVNIASVNDQSGSPPWYNSPDVSSPPGNNTDGPSAFWFLSFRVIDRHREQQHEDAEDLEDEFDHLDFPPAPIVQAIDRRPRRRP